METIRPHKINTNRKFSFGDVLKQLREEKNLSQLDLADALGTTPQSIGRYEQNKREPSFDVLLKICDFFDVSTDFLLGKSAARNAPIDDLTAILSCYDSEYFKKSLNNYPSEFKEPILKLIAELSIAFADLECPINIDKLFVLSSIHNAIEEVLSYKTPITDDMTEDEITKLIQICFTNQGLIQNICNYFFKKILISDDIDNFIFKNFLLNKNSYDNRFN